MSVFHPMILNVPEIWALPAAEFKLYAALLTFCRSDGSGAFPTNETLAEMVGVNERSIRRLLSELESKGVIDKTTEERANGSFKRTITVNYVPVIRAGHASVSKTWESNQNGEDMDNLPHVTDNRGGGCQEPGGGGYWQPQNIPIKNIPILTTTTTKREKLQAQRSGRTRSLSR